MKLLIVIVNYRTADLTIDCLRSLVDEVKSVPGTRVVVTDNLSCDDSLPRLRGALDANGWNAWASLMPLPRNGGFAYGNNEGIRPFLRSDDAPEYVLLLNPDTVVRPGALASLVQFMDQHANVGIAGSRLEHPDGTPQRSAFRFHSIAGELESGLRLGIVSRVLSRSVVAPPAPPESAPTGWVAGASMIIRRETIDEIGLLDESYFMYFEEVDFCLRAQRAGWPCWYVPDSRVVHLVGQASGVTDPTRSRKRRPGYWFDSRRRYFVKNHGWFYAALADAAWAIGFAAWRLRRFIQRKPDQDPANLLGDFIRHSVFVKGFHP